MTTLLQTRPGRLAGAERGEVSVLVAQDDAGVADLLLTALDRWPGLRVVGSEPTDGGVAFQVTIDEGLARAVEPRAQREGLSEREMDVLRLMVDGLSNAEIAGRLRIGEETVKSHAKRILAKLNARSRAHVTALAIRLGLVS